LWTNSSARAINWLRLLPVGARWQREPGETTLFRRKALRVLYYIAYPQRMAGANRSLFALVTRLPPAVSPLIVLSDEGEVADQYRQAGIETLIVRPPGPLSLYGNAMVGWSHTRRVWEAIHSLLPYTMQLRGILRRHAIDVVHVNDLRGALMAGPAARAAGCPVVGHLRGEVPLPGLPRRFFEWVCDRIITVADSLHTSLSPAARKKCTTVYNGIDCQSILRSACGSVPPCLKGLSERHQCVVCCFASVVPFKGLHHLLHATAELNARGWQDRLAVVSVGDWVEEYAGYQAWLREQQRKLAVSNFHWAGWQPNPFSFYRSADFTVLPSVSRERLRCGDRTIEVRGGEGFPRTHLEAMCFGLPVVGTRIAGVPEQIVDGQTGFVVPPSDVPSLVQAMERLLTDEALRRQMGAWARQRVEQRFSMNQYVNGVWQVYQALVAPLRAAA
jgi:glycosyltransferase involved in cell wall biosynthesis